MNHLNKNQKQRIVNKINEKNFSLKKVLYLLYEFDKELVIDHIIFAVMEKKLTKTVFLMLFEEIKNFKLKEFPINGADLIKLGFKEGKRIGNVLIETKKWWIKNNYQPLKKQCINFALEFLPTSSRR